MSSFSAVLYILYEFVVKIQIFWLESSKEDEAYKSHHGVEPQSETLYRARKYFGLLFKILFKTKILLVSGLLICCVLGLSVSKMFFAFLLLDIISISPILLNVIRSISLNFASLSTTWVFIMIMAYIYSSIAYFNSAIRHNQLLLDQDDFVLCSTFATCFWNTLNLGIKQGGGLGELLRIPDPSKETADYLYRTFFDLVFFVTMILILLNIILGIIIDSFAELRDLRLQIGNLRLSRKRHEQRVLRLQHQQA
jgi:hypothetical protein